MLGIFGSVLERLQGLFGKRYLVVGVGPVLLWLALSLPLAIRVTPEISYHFNDLLALSPTHQVLVGFLVALAVGVFGFVLFMANSWWRTMLESGPFHALEWKFFRSGEQARHDRLVKRLVDSRPDLVKLRRIGSMNDSAGWGASLATARGKAAPGAGRGEPIPETLTGDFEALVGRREAEQPISYSDLENVFKGLQRELALKDADEFPALDRMQVELLEIADHARRMAETEFARVQGVLRRRFPADESRITGSVLGNVSIAARDYFVLRYGMSLESFWPLVEARAAADEKGTMPAALDEAKSRVDFTISMNAVTVLFTAGWLATMAAVRADALWLYLVGGLGAGAAVLFYWLAIWNTYVFHSWVRSAVELYRFEVLGALHVGLPADSTNEREVWVRLTRLSELGEGQVAFKHS